MEYAQKAITIRRSFFGLRHLKLANTHQTIANIYMKMDDQSKALTYLEKAITIYKAKLPENHPDLNRVLKKRNNILNVMKSKN